MPDPVYRPQGSHLDILRAKDPVVLAAGPSGTGKTRAILEKSYLIAAKYPGSRQLYVRKTRTSLTNSALVCFEDEVLPAGHYLRSKGGQREHRTNYRFRNGSEIVLLGLDSDATEKVLSSQYDWIYPQEATEIEEEIAQYLLTRLRNGVVPYQQMLMDCNPTQPRHWLKRWVDEGRCRYIYSTHKDNPRYWDEKAQKWTPEGESYVFGTLANLTAHARARFFEGKWVAAEGARWPQFDSTLGGHVFRMAEVFPKGLPSNAEIVLGVDYGQRAPYCALWIACVGGDLYVFRCDYEAGLTPDKQAERMANLTGSNERIRLVRADPSIWNNLPDATKSRPSGVSVHRFWRDVLGKDARFGPIVPGFNKSRAQGMAAIDMALNRGNGLPDLYIEEGCRALIEELSGAIWMENERGGKEDIDPKCADHAITALYYGIFPYLVEIEEEKSEEPRTHEERVARQLLETYDRDYQSL